MISLKDIFKIVPFVITIILIAIFAIQSLGGDETFIKQFIDNYGYLAALALAFLSGFVVTIPLPAAIWISYYLDAGLSYVLIIAVITIGQTAADTVSLLLASFIENIVEKKYKKFVVFLEKFKKKGYKIPLVIFFFWVIFAPLPNEILGYVMIFLGYRLKVLLPIVLIGNIFFNILLTKSIENKIWEWLQIPWF